MTTIYLIGALKNFRVPEIAQDLRREGYDVFDDWFAAGTFADTYWKMYEQGRGHSYIQALKGYAAQHVYKYDRLHLDRCDVGVLIMPAGKSAMLELGLILGQKKPGYILLEPDNDRWDVMLAAATGIYDDMTELKYALANR